MSTKLAIWILLLIAGLTIGLWIGLRLGELKELSGNSPPTSSLYPTEEPTPYETPYPTDYDSSGPEE